MIAILAFAALTLVNHGLTPGAIRPLSVKEVCETKWGLDVRHVTDHDRWVVFKAYGVRDEDRHLYIIDHLVPRELGGADEFANLWPQRRDRSKVKDKQENALHRAVCAPTPIISLESAQQQMRQWGQE